MSNIPGHSVKRRAVLLITAVLTAAALTTIHSRPAAAEPSVADLEHKVDKASDDLEVIVEDYNAITEQLDELETRHDSTRESLLPLRARTAAASDEVGSIADELYTAGPAATIMPFVAGTPDTIADRLSVLNYIAYDRSTHISELAELAGRLSDQNTEIADLTEQRDTLQAKKTDTEDTINDAVADLNRLRHQALGAGYRDDPGVAPPPLSTSATGAAATAVQFAYDAIGAPYEWGGSGPGYDCSGLTAAAWGAAGVSLPHNAAQQSDAVPHVRRDELQPGDLVFYYADIHHVAIYVGDGKVIHAPDVGQTVRADGMDDMPVQGYGRPG